MLGNFLVFTPTLASGTTTMSHKTDSIFFFVDSQSIGSIITFAIFGHQYQIVTFVIPKLWSEKNRAWSHTHTHTHTNKNGLRVQGLDDCTSNQREERGGRGG